MSMSKINLFVCISIAICSLSSCIPIIHTRVLAVFKNCTNDTVYIGVSHYDNIDSIEAQLAPCYDIPVNSNLDTAEISLWEKRIKNMGMNFTQMNVSMLLKTVTYTQIRLVL